MRRGAAGLGTLALVGGLAVTASLAAPAAVAEGAPATAAATQGCGYGTDGPEADTICWIDMSDFDPTVAGTPGGQPMSIALPGGHVMSFSA